MKFDFENYIVISKGSSLDDYKTKNGYEYTIEGAKIYPLETALPIIIQGSGCVGVGWITRYIVTTTSTTISFDKLIFNKPEVLEAYYNLYKAVASNDENSEDVIIPGLKKKKERAPKNKFRVDNDSYSRSSNKKFIDSLDDIDDDDSDDVSSFFRNLRDF